MFSFGDHMSALFAHSQDTQMGGLSEDSFRSGVFVFGTYGLGTSFSILPKAFLQSGMSAPTSFSNFAALAYCLKALA